MRHTVTCLPVLLLLPTFAWGHPHHDGEENDTQHSIQADSADHAAAPSVAFPARSHLSQVTLTERDGYRYIVSNGLPDHQPGEFPNPGNPNRITAQEYAFRVPLEPQERQDGPPPRGKYLFGVALNGVPFDPGTAEIWTPNGRSQGRGQWRYEALTGRINLGLDEHNAHVQPGGKYHYHALPTGLYESLAGKPADQVPDHMVMIGYAADGYPIYGVYGHTNANDPDSPLKEFKPSYRIKEGNRPNGNDSPGGAYDGRFTADWEYVAGLGDLDEHNGRTGVTPEYPDGTYYYVVSPDYPFVPRSFKGTPDDSFRENGPGPGGDGPPQRGPHGNRPGPPGDRPPPPLR